MYTKRVLKSLICQCIYVTTILALGHRQCTDWTDLLYMATHWSTRRHHNKSNPRLRWASSSYPHTFVLGYDNTTAACVHIKIIECSVPDPDTLKRRCSSRGPREKKSGAKTLFGILHVQMTIFEPLWIRHWCSVNNSGVPFNKLYTII